MEKLQNILCVHHSSLYEEVVGIGPRKWMRFLRRHTEQNFT